jgi:hypothetical protein
MVVDRTTLFSVRGARRLARARTAKLMVTTSLEIGDGEESAAAAASDVIGPLMEWRL